MTSWLIHTAIGIVIVFVFLLVGISFRQVFL